MCVSGGRDRPASPGTNPLSSLEQKDGQALSNVVPFLQLSEGLSAVRCEWIGMCKIRELWE